MSLSFPKVKGFKKDKRNILESTRNLVVFGHGQTSQEVTNAGARGRRLLRRGSLRQRRSSKPKSAFTSGTGSTTEKLERLSQRIELTNYFANTKPWKLSQTDQQQLENTEIPAGSPGGGSEEVTIAGSQTPKQQASVVSSNDTTTNAGSIPSPLVTFVNAIVCPVCLKGFEPLMYNNVPASEVMRHSLAAYQLHANDTIYRKNLEDGWGASAKPKCTLDPQDVVVAGNCGELFHRLCLRDWCSRGHKKSPRTSKPVANCPSCGKELKYTMCQEIEIIRCFSKDHTKLHKEFIKVKHVNRELQMLWPETRDYLAKIKREIQDTETLFNELKSKRRSVKSELKKLTADDLSIVMAKVTDVDTLKNSLARQEKAMQFMQQETLQIMRMYLLTVLRKLKACGTPVPSCGDIPSIPDYASIIGRIPNSLVPHLKDILNDDHALSLLSRILAPFRGEESDESQQKYLELELVQKFAASNSQPNLTRPNTYVVESSAPEVGDSDSEDVMAKKLTTASSVEEEAVIAASSLKASTARHEIPTISDHNQAQNILCTGILSNASIICKDKPPKLFEILEIAKSNSTINSDKLEEPLQKLESPSPNGGGSVDKTYILPSSPNLSHKSSQPPVVLKDSSVVQFPKESSGSFPNSDPTESIHQYEQDSKYVRAIRQLMKQSQINAPPSTPQTAITLQSTGENSGAAESQIKEPAAKEVINIHDGCINEAKSLPSSTNSDTCQLNDMLIAFMRRQQNLRLPSKSSKTTIKTENVEGDRDAKADFGAPDSAFSDNALPPPPPPNNSENGSNRSVGSELSNNVKQKNDKFDDSWITVTMDEESAGSQRCLLKKNASSLEITSQTSNSSKPKSLESNGSYEPVYTKGYKMSSPSEAIKSDYSSVENATVSKPKDDKVSIAIMYIIDDEDEEDTEEELDDEKSTSETSVADKIEKEEDTKDFEEKELLPRPLPTKVISPIFLTAEKASTYSMIANEFGSASSTDMFAPLAWPRPSRMIPVDTPSNVNINSSPSHQDFSASYNDRNDDKQINSPGMLNQNKPGLMSLPLPPLPDENSVATLFYENETTGMANSLNKIKNCS